eukprot:scaffold93029_cov37-Phaeocystis_antarctica.AAC.1
MALGSTALARNVFSSWLGLGLGLGLGPGLGLGVASFRAAARAMHAVSVASSMRPWVSPQGPRPAMRVLWRALRV